MENSFSIPENVSLQPSKVSPRLADILAEEIPDEMIVAFLGLRENPQPPSVLASLEDASLQTRKELVDEINLYLSTSEVTVQTPSKGRWSNVSSEERQVVMDTSRREAVVRWGESYLAVKETGIEGISPYPGPVVIVRGTRQQLRIAIALIEVIEAEADFDLPVEFLTSES